MTGISHHRRHHSAITHAVTLEASEAATPVSIKHPSIQSQLNHLQAQLTEINQAMHAMQKRSQASSTESVQAQLMAAVNHAIQTDHHLLIDEMTADHRNLDHVIDTFNEALKQRLAATPASHHVSAARLPFTVVSIDNIQQADVVTVSYSRRILPLEVGELLAGWRLSSANSANMTAEFTDNHHDVATIALNQADTSQQESD